MRSTAYISLAFTLSMLVAPASVRAQTATDGPFGLPAGMTIAKLRAAGGKLVDNEKFVYRVTKPPKPHPSFEFFSVMATPVHGVCKVTGAGVDVQTNVYGTSLRTAFTNLRDAIATKYGPPRDFDFLNSGSIWDDPQDFMMALVKEERTLAAFWGGDAGPVNGVGSILLDAMALSTSKGYVRVSYEYPNFEACKAYMDSQENSVL